MTPGRYLDKHAGCSAKGDGQQQLSKGTSIEKEITKSKIFTAYVYVVGKHVKGLQEVTDHLLFN